MPEIVTASMVKLANGLKRRAERGLHRGDEASMIYLLGCREDHPKTGSRVLYTRDQGHHTSGWWKNPDYERCYHLSLSFFDPETGQMAPHNPKLSAAWVELFFGDHRRLLWVEPPYSPEGRQAEVWHYRLFTDPAWQPTLPRGEVYSKQFTEAGWKSYSDVQAEQTDLAARVIRQLGAEAVGA